MKLESRASFGWPAVEASVAPCGNGLVVHYDGSPRPRGVAAMAHEKCRQYWRDTRKFHMGPDRRWLDIGYSFGVCGHGTVFEGRGWKRQQAAQPGGNSTWTSVTLMLGEGESPTTAQIEGVRELRAWLRSKGLAAAVKGHRDFVSTTCPGGPLYALVKDGTFAKAPTSAKRAAAVKAPAWSGRVLANRKPMMHGSDVLAWQTQMRKRGWTITTDGYFGPDCAILARSFQKQKGLKVTGKVDEATWKAAWLSKVT